ncbi:MAG: hypothetical protein RJA51_699 [Actinomycetota bacterium]
MFWRETSMARRPAPAAFGSASPPFSTFAAFAMTTFWFFQMTIQTFAAMVMPSSMPTVIAAFLAFADVLPAWFMKSCM